MRPALVLLALAGLCLADPVPERPAVEGPAGSRGEPSLRAPSGGVDATLSHLLHSCIRCHGAGGRNARLFADDGWLNGRAKPARLLWGVGIVLRSEPGASWYPLPWERPNLERAARLLEGRP